MWGGHERAKSRKSVYFATLRPLYAYDLEPDARFRCLSLPVLGQVRRLVARLASNAGLLAQLGHDAFVTPAGIGSTKYGTASDQCIGSSSANVGDVAGVYAAIYL